MADNVQFQITDMPERYFSVNPVCLNEYQFNDVIPEMASKQDLYTLVKTMDADKPAENQTQKLGSLVDRHHANLTLPAAGRYLSCQVRLNSMVAYAAIWDALYIHSLSLDTALDPAPDPDGYSLEIFHQESDWQEGVYEMTLSLALKSV